MVTVVRVAVLSLNIPVILIHKIAFFFLHGPNSRVMQKGDNDKIRKLFDCLSWMLTQTFLCVRGGCHVIFLHGRIS